MQSTIHPPRVQRTCSQGPDLASAAPGAPGREHRAGGGSRGVAGGRTHGHEGQGSGDDGAEREQTEGRHG